MMLNCYISFVGTTLQFETEVPDSVLLLVQFAPIYLKCLRVGSVTFCHGSISPGLKSFIKLLLANCNWLSNLS